MKRVILILWMVVAIVALSWTQSVRAVAAGKDDDVKTFMQAKLEHSKNVLSGLATEDFDMIAKDSQQLTLLSLDADWQVLQTPEYAQLSLDFRRLSQSLTDSAKKKNLDGATIAYVGLTFKCVECHKYIRSVEMAQLNERQRPLLPGRYDSAATLLNRQPLAGLTGVANQD